MRYQPGEDFDQWVQKVGTYEYGIALTQLAQGVPVEDIMNRMSRRIIDKLNHPVFGEIREMIASKQIDNDENIK
jgi:glutamyl-tRNA reductase